MFEIGFYFYLHEKPEGKIFPSEKISRLTHNKIFLELHFINRKKTA